MLKPDKILIKSSEIKQRVKELGAELRQEYEGQPMVLLGLMNGALFFLTDLLRELPPEAEVQCSNVSSYAGT